MRILRLLFGITAMALVGLSSQGIAQVGWTTMNTMTTRDLEGVFTVSALQTIAVGASGTIVGTTNGGASWISAPSGTSERLRKVVVAGFTTPVVWIVGDAGTLLLSTSGGFTWNSVTSGTSSDLHDIWAIDYANATSFCVVGKSGTILGTTNSGAAWTPQSSPTSNNLNGVFFTDPLLGCIAGDAGVVLITTDGGSNWSTASSGVSGDLNHVFFTSQLIGWIAGDNGVILTTTDGGQNWAGVASGVSEDLRRIFFTDAQTGTIVGRSGTILRTTNAGASWTKQTSGTILDLNSVFFTDANNGIVVGNSGLAKKTINGGVPVELEHFSANVLTDGTVRLEWSTVAETQNYGFHIERAEGAKWASIGFVPGGGDSEQHRSYTFTDHAAAKIHELRYRLRQVDFDGSWEFSPEVLVHAALPSVWSLSVSPNPCTEFATLHAALPTDEIISLTVFDASGKHVSSIFEGQANAGSHVWRWAPGSAAPGVYYAVLRSGTSVLSTPVIVQ